MRGINENLLARIQKLEREVERLQVKERPVGGGGGVTDHGALTGLADNDHPQYLLTTGKASDSDKLDGVDSTGFATAGHNHSGVYLPVSGKAADSDKLDGLNSTDFGRPVFLAAPLTSTAWDGDAYSTTAKTLIDLSSVFGAPAGIKAALFNVALRDSGSAANECLISLSPSSGSGGLTARCSGIANDKFVNACLVVPCDANGDVYYDIAASGSGTMDVYLQIYGYWL